MTRSRPALAIDVLVASKRWKDAEKAEVIVRRAVTRAAAATLSTAQAELAIVLTDDSAIRLLNRDWRGVDAATNVLSFPAKAARGRHLGDIVLAFETIAREARSEAKPLAHHIAHLAVHGFLHLIGYDHEKDDDAEAMEEAERKILRQLAIPDPYRPADPPEWRRALRKATPRAAAKKGAKLASGRAANRAGGRTGRASRRS